MDCQRRRLNGIALCGYMGCGKSSTARELGRICDLPVLDLDDEIEKAHGSIAELFANQGEAAFRDIEFAVLTQLLSQAKPVLALGGGAVLAKRNRNLLAEAGYRTVFLRAPVWLMWSRVARDQKRPLAAGNMADFVRRYRARLPVYRQLDTMISAYPGDPHQIALRILQRCRCPNHTRSSK